MKLTKNLATIVSILCSRYLLKKALCECSHCQDTPPSLFAYVCTLIGTIPLPPVNGSIIECPLISLSIVSLLALNSGYDTKVFPFGGNNLHGRIFSAEN